jgi:hypothetical protein
MGMPVNLFTELYYISHINNIPSIVANGILSRRLIQQRNIRPVDISDAEVQRWRDLTEPVYGRPIHEYVPLYFNPLNAMLYKRKDFRNSLTILCFERDHLAQYDHVFTDGNAASTTTRFSRDFSVVEESSEALAAHQWSELTDGKRRRCAEMLVYRRIPPRLISKAYCFGDPPRAQLADALQSDVIVDRGMFY